MTFPFMTTGFTGWQPSFINFQMCSTNPMNSMNILWNQLNTKSIADSMVYNYPVFSMGNFTPFFGDTNYNTLLDPSLAVMQTWWKSNNPSNGWSGFNNTAFGNMDFSNLWGNYNNGGGNNNTLGDDRTKTEEQISYQRKYNKLLSLMKQLKESDKLSQTEKDAINAAIIADNENSRGEWKDKFNALKKVYDEKIDDKNIKKYIINSMTMGTEESPDADEVFKVRLTDAGFEYRADSIDARLDALKTAIDELSDSNPTITNGLIGELDIESADTNILDLISSWNSEKGSLNVDNKRIMAYIADKYNDSKIKDESREEIKTSLVKPLYLSLINKAKDLANQLEGEEIDNLTNAITALTTEYDKLDKNMSTSFVQAFDNLYIATRWAAIKVIAKDADEYYGDIDSMFNRELFDEDTKKDLKSEGFSDTEISAQKVNYQAIEHDDADQGNNNGSGTLGTTPEEQAAALQQQGYIAVLQGKTYADGEAVYEEIEGTNSDGTKKLFIIKDGKWMELKNPTLDANGKYTANSLQEITAEKIKEYKEDKLAAEEAERLAAEEAKTIQKSQGAAFWAGKEAKEFLCRWTKKDQRNEVDKRLNIVNKDNVLEFLKGVYQNTAVDGGSGRFSVEGFIEKLVDDAKTDTDTIVKFLEAVQAKAKELGLEPSDDSSNEYTVLKIILEYIKRDHSDLNSRIGRTNVINWNGYLGEKAINWKLFGNKITEAIDPILERLYKKMLAAENPPAQAQE